jgi:cyclopropane fatty-acyl-phospholipid synthase-like methyltransferase
MVESQYSPIFEAKPVTLGAMAGHTWETDPKRLGFTLARYKFVAKMLTGSKRVLEVGCGDAWATAIVAREVEHITAVDFDRRFFDGDRRPQNVNLCEADAVHHELPGGNFDAAYALDVLEHIKPEDEGPFLGRICNSLTKSGTLIIGSPSAESQPYASQLSREGHVNCKTEEELKATLCRFFDNVFTFGMNDESIHTGFGPMCHYRLAVCCGVKA